MQNSLALMLLAGATVVRQDEPMAGSPVATAPPPPPHTPVPPPRDLLLPESLNPSDPDYYLKARLRAQEPVPCLDWLPGRPPEPGMPGYVVRRAASLAEADERHRRIAAEVEARYGCLAKQQRLAEKAERKARKAAAAARRKEAAERKAAEASARAARKAANRAAVQRKRSAARAQLATAGRPQPAGSKPQPRKRGGKGRGAARHTGRTNPKSAGTSPRAKPSQPRQTATRTAPAPDTAKPTPTPQCVKPTQPSRSNQPTQPSRSKPQRRRPRTSPTLKRLYGVVTALAVTLGCSKRQATWARSRIRKVLERNEPTPGAGLHVLLALNKPEAFARPTDKTQQQGWAEEPEEQAQHEADYEELSEYDLDARREHEERYLCASDLYTPEPVAVLPITRSDLEADTISHNLRVAEQKTAAEENALWGDEGQASAVWAMAQDRSGEALKTWRQQTAMEWGPKKGKQHIDVGQPVRRSHIDALADLVYTPTEDPRRGAAHIRIRKGDVEVVPNQDIWTSMTMGPGIPAVSELEPETKQLNGCVLPAAGGVVLF